MRSDQVCLICGNNTFEIYSYNNHNRNISLWLKALVGLFLYHISKTLKFSYYQRFIFAKPMSISRCKECKHGSLIDKITNDDLNSYYLHKFWNTVGLVMPNENIRAEGQYKYVNDYLKDDELKNIGITYHNVCEISRQLQEREPKRFEEITDDPEPMEEIN